MVIGMEVPHAHIHLIPINEENDMNLSKPRIKFTHENLLRLPKKLQKNISL